MSLSLLEPLMAGNAVRLFVDPPRSARWWRVLRRTADSFTGPEDAGAVLVADRCTDNVVLDLKALENGKPYFYRCYTWDGAAWDKPVTMSVTPDATYAGDTTDPVALLADRLRAGLAEEVRRGTLKPGASDEVKVLRAPSMLADQVEYPCAVVHLDSVGPAERFLGESILPQQLNDDGTWAETEGWLARWSIGVALIARNHEGRVALRRALFRILQANIPVWSASGLTAVEFTATDSEQLEGQNAFLFFTGGTFACVAPMYVSANVDPVRDVLVTARTTPETTDPDKAIRYTLP